MKNKTYKIIFVFIVTMILALATHFSVMAANNSSTPDTPVVESVRNYQEGIKVQWSAVQNVNGYYVYRSVDDSSFTKVGFVRNNLFFVDKEIENGHKYSYKVKSLNSIGGMFLSAYSNKKSTYGICLTEISADCTSTGIKVTWEKVSGVDGYKIYRRQAGESEYKYLLTKSGEDSVSLVNTSAQKGIWYEYKVRPYKKVGSTTYINWSDDMNYVSGIRPNKVTGVNVSSPAARKVQINWNFLDEAEGYIVSQKNTKTGVATNRYYTKSTNSASFGVSGGATYSYTVRAYYTNEQHTRFTGPFSDKKTVDVSGCIEHQYEWVTTKEPTCTSKGAAKETCTVCGYVNSTKSLPKLNHVYGEPEILVESTGCEFGQQKLTCINCGYTFEQGYQLYPCESGTWYFETPTGDGGMYMVVKRCDVCHRWMDEISFDYFITLPTETEDGLGYITFPKKREIPIPAGAVIPPDMPIYYYQG